MKLKPCPFCGGEAITESRFVSYEGVVTIRHDVICNGCGCKIENFQSKEQAIEAWNRRKPLEDIVEQLKVEAWEFESFGHENTWVVDLPDAIEIVKGGAV